MRIVFDLDDTICRTCNRDYENAEPNVITIEKIREVKSHGAYIIILTARGMLSCCGDIQQAERKNRQTIEKWLETHNVPYDEIVFGKPYADIYVDDKAVGLTDWEKTGVTIMRGFSGKEVYHIGNLVVKPTDDAIKVGNWFKENETNIKRFFSIPRVLSANNGMITMEYINGNILSNIFNPSRLAVILKKIKGFSTVGLGAYNDMQKYWEFVEQRANGKFTDFITWAKNAKYPLSSVQTLCHGDFTLQNIIVDTFGNYYLIDPSIKEFNTYLLDIAKLRASMNGLDLAISKDGRMFTAYVPLLDKKLSEQELAEVKVLEVSHFIRVLPFAEKIGNYESCEIIKSCIERLVKELGI